MAQTTHTNPAEHTFTLVSFEFIVAIEVRFPTALLKEIVEGG